MTVPGAASRWLLPHYLALAGALLLALQAWVLGSWLADGPRQVTEFRAGGGSSHAVAIVVQIAVVLIGVGMSAHLVRTCRREHRLTFDAQLAIAMLLTAWLDPLPNFVQPVWFLSSELVNVTSWGGHYPLQVNPVAGDLPWPVVLLVGVYAFGVLGIVMALNALTRAIGRRWPLLSRAQLVAITYAAIVVLHPLLEAPIIGLHIWVLAGSPAGDGWHRIHPAYSWFQAPMASFMIGTLAAWRLLLTMTAASDRRRARPDRVDPRRRTALSLLALIALCGTSC